MSPSTLQRSRSRHIRRACFETLEDRRLLSFSPATSFPVGTDPQSVVTADFNNDGKPDLATSNYDRATGDGTVSALLGNGDGTLQPAQASAYPFSLAAADFNADGKIDLATGNYDYSEVNDVSILLGHGDGTFAVPVALDVSLAEDSVFADTRRGTRTPRPRENAATVLARHPTQFLSCNKLLLATDSRAEYRHRSRVARSA